VEIVGTSRMERRSCAASVSHDERLEGVVGYHAAIGDVELRAAGGSAWIEAGPCDVAARPCVEDLTPAAAMPLSMNGSRRDISRKTSLKSMSWHGDQVFVRL
jgi:hypothetical protein